MRRPTTTVLALALVACAALAAHVSPAAAVPGPATLTFSRAAEEASASPAAAAGRVWLLLTREAPSRPALDDDGGFTADDIPDVTEASLPPDAAGRLALLHAAGVATGASTLAQALSELELPFMFAGREQWILNLTTPDGAAADPRLWNVTMESPVHDPNALGLLLGRASWTIDEGRSMAADVAYWETLVPEWAPRVRDALAERGIPFSVELLSSPELQLDDPSKPLFPHGTHPPSLHQLGVEQLGEGTFLRGLSAEELMLQVWPLYWRYFHRPAGSPVPDDVAPGLMFGTLMTESCEGLEDGCVNGIRYRRSPVMSTDAYLRWSAYGMPGDPTQNGVLVDQGLGWAYIPLTNEFVQVNDGWGDRYSVERRRWLQILSTGGIKPNYFTNMPWVDVVSTFLMSRIAVAGFLHDPSIWFVGPHEPYAPDRVDPDALSRYRILRAEA